MEDNTTKVVVEPEAKERAYRMGYDRFTHEPNEPIDDMWFSHYTESAEWAHTKLPQLRCMAGYEDTMGKGTYQGSQDIVVVEYPEDRPMDGEIVESHYLFQELVEHFRMGAYDKIHGNDQYENLE